ncbi:MAG: ComEA family DNA-binding protein [Gemmatimonadota bacterium]
MSNADTAQLRRAAYLLLAVSVVRTAWDASLRSRSPAAQDVLPGLMDAAEERSAVLERARTPLSEGDRIDPNRADVVELDRLPGIGPVVAAAIVSARDEGVAFEGPGDLARVPGIGPSTVDKLRPWLEFGPRPSLRRRATAAGRAGPIPIEVNTAPEDELIDLPGIGPALAQRIVELRPFTSVNDLQRVSGIGPATIERLRPLVRVGGR